MAPLHLLDVGSLGRGDELTRQGPVRAVRGQPQPLGGHLSQRGDEPERVIRVGMGEHGQVQPLDAGGAQEGDDDAQPGIRAPAGRTPWSATVASGGRRQLRP